MAKSLMIVESPKKAKTLDGYLGQKCRVRSCYGHVRDLEPKTGAVNPERGFALKYKVIEKNVKYVEEICRLVEGSDAIYLATDPDREGEAIAWHLYELLKERKALKNQPVYRIAFHSFTKGAVQAAIENPREISMDLVNAQQARRALDYLVGFNLSPLLWKKIRRGLSAGRVQSPALRMIVEREELIDKFKTEEYWTIEANVKASDQKQPFRARLIEYSNEKLEQFSITTAAQAKQIEDELRTLASGQLTVTQVNKTQRKRHPAAPFITSTLQQEAYRKLGFTSKRTMRIAQQLYEGVDVGEGAVGLITYMRTDSVSLVEEAVSELRNFIGERYGKNALPPTPRVYKTKTKNAQEAHEAIRPTLVHLVPEKIKQSLTPDQYKLYNLIWKRAVASQMIHATMDLVAIDFSCGPGNCLRANGSTITSPGFIQVYIESVDDHESEEGEKLLPPLREGDIVDLVMLEAVQHFTEPPPRFSEASLVKTLEEHGIGRPSTYASIISTLQTRDYVELDSKRFKPTDVGKIVSKFLTQHFTQYVDYDFTAKLEDSLDDVSRGEKQWVPLLEEFWKPFIELIQSTEENVQRKDVTQEALEENCPKCDRKLSIRLGKRGRFIGCTGYPECDYTRNLEDDKAAVLQPIVVEGRQCPKCDASLVIKHGRYGKFVGCSQYPTCKHIESLEKSEDTAVTCPTCHTGTLIKRKSRFGTFFYACNQYPECKYAVNSPPLSEQCPKCQWPILILKTTKRRGTEKVCPQKECDFTKLVEDPGAVATE